MELGELPPDLCDDVVRGLRRLVLAGRVDDAPVEDVGVDEAAGRRGAALLLVLRAPLVVPEREPVVPERGRARARDEEAACS